MIMQDKSGQVGGSKGVSVSNELIEDLKLHRTAPEKCLVPQELPKSWFPTHFE